MRNRVRNLRSGAVRPAQLTNAAGEPGGRRRAERRPPAPIVLAASTAALALLPAVPAPAAPALTHEYSFNESTTANNSVVNDSVNGGANATLVTVSDTGTGNGTATIGGGVLTLNNGTTNATGGAYVKLPNNVLGSGATSATIEVWGTYPTTGGGWERIFDIGSTTTNNLFMTPKSGAGDTRLRLNTANNEAGVIVAGTPLIGTTQQVMTAVVVSTGANSSTLNLYQNGLLLGTSNVNLSLANLVQTADYIGKSQFSDPYLNGTIDEFRTYGGAMTPGQALQDVTLGTAFVAAGQTSTTSAQAATLNTWNSTTSEFSTAGNWSQGHVPQAGEVGVLGNGGTITVTTTTASTQQLQITSGTLTINGAVTFTPAGGVDLAPGSGSGTAAVNVTGGGTLVTPGLFVDSDMTTTGTAAKTLNLDGGTLQATGPITLGGTALTLSIGAGGGTFNTNGNPITLNAAVSGNGALAKTGAGTLTLAVASTYTGVTTLTAGTLSTGTTGTLGNGGTASSIGNSSNAAANLVLNGGTLQYASTGVATSTDRLLTLGPAGGALDASGTNPITFAGNGTGAANAIAFSGSNTSPTLTFTGSNTGANTFAPIIGNNGTGLTAVTKTGTGAWTLTAANTYTGATTVTQGTLILPASGSITSSTGSQVTIGNTANQNALLQINGGTLNAQKNTTPSVNVGTVANNAGAVNISSGTLTSANQLYLGSIANGYGALTQTGGSVTVQNWLAVGRSGNGVINQSGGTLAVNTNPLTLGTVGANAQALMNMSGNAVANIASNVYLPEQQAGVVAVLNVSGNAALNVSGTSGIDFGLTGAVVNTGTLNLNGGTVTTKILQKGAGTGTYLVNFNGGTLKAQTAATSATFFTGLTGAYVYGGGGTIDTNGQSITIGQQLLAPTGNGITAGTLSFGGTNSGYIDTPIVNVNSTGTGGTGATAVAILNYATGQLTGITITNPGTGYTSAPTFTLTGGGGAATIAGAATLSPNVGGAITKAGSGTLTLTAANTYSGGTTVSAGTLAGTVDGVFGTGNVTVASGGTLTESGGTTNNYIADTAALSIASGGTVNLNYNGTDTIGSLIINGVTMGPGTYGPSATSEPGLASTGTGTVTVTPEPASVALLGLASLGLLSRRRRRAGREG